MSREEIARLAGVPVGEVEEAAAYEVRHDLAGRVPDVVLEVVLEHPAAYWRIAGRYWWDDPTFGDPAPIDELRYDQELGLHHPRIFGTGGDTPDGD